MKSAIAAAAMAAVASAHEARSPLQLNLDVAHLVKVDLCLGLDVKLPLGISIETDGCPTSSPPPGYVNIWHPPHHVPMDDCDDNSNHEWHYVHPCGCQAPAPHIWTTSTVTATQVHTITSCAPTVTDCPAGPHVTTVVVPVTTSVCPVPVTTTTLATVPVTSAPATVPVVTQTPPPVWTKPVVTQPGPQVPPPSATTPCPETVTTPVVAVPPPVTKPGTTGSPVVVPPPVGTGYQPPAGNWTQPPVIAGAAQNTQKVGAVVAMCLVASLLI